MNSKRTSRRLGQAIQKIDMLGHPVEFNIGGESKIPSKVGSCITFLLGIVFFTFSALRGL